MVLVILFLITCVLFLTGHITLTLISFAITFSIGWYFGGSEFSLSRLNPGYQHYVVAPLIKRMNPSARYIPNKGLHYKSVIRSQLVDEMPSTKFSSNNFISYGDQGLAVRFAHIEILKKSANDIYPVTVGLFGITDTFRPVKGRTIITFDLAEKHFGFVGQGVQRDEKYHGLKKMRLDSSAFEKQYIVYSDDPIEANFLLSFTVMEKLAHLIEKYSIHPMISFTGDKIYLIVHSFGFFQYFDDWTFDATERSIKSLGFAMEAFKAIHHHHKL